MRCLLVALAMAAPAAARAEVADQAPDGFVVVHELVLNAVPSRAFVALTDEVAAWWNAGHSYSGKAENFSLEPRAGGCFCERLPDGGSVEHMRVVFAAPGTRLRMTGGLGPLQGMGASGVMDFALSPQGEDRTRLQFRYTVGGYVPDGLEAMAAPVDGVLAEQLSRLQTYLKSDK